MLSLDRLRADRIGTDTLSKLHHLKGDGHPPLVHANLTSERRKRARNPSNYLNPTHPLSTTAPHILATLQVMRLGNHLTHERILLARVHDPQNSQPTKGRCHAPIVEDGLPLPSEMLARWPCSGIFQPRLFFFTSKANLV